MRPPLGAESWSAAVLVDVVTAAVSSCAWRLSCIWITLSLSPSSTSGSSSLSVPSSSSPLLSSGYASFFFPIYIHVLVYITTTMQQLLILSSFFINIEFYINDYVNTTLCHTTAEFYKKLD